MSQINSNIKDDFQVVFLLSCFVGHPVPTVHTFGTVNFTHMTPPGIYSVETVENQDDIFTIFNNDF